MAYNKRGKIRFFLASVEMLVVAITFSGCTLASTSEEKFAKYGKWQTYSASQALHYPDFDLLYTEDEKIGEEELNRRIDLNLGPVYHFSISSNTSRTSVYWSSGTGDIGPSSFEIDGKKFVLEMIMSDYLERPISDEQVAIWPEGEFDRRKNRWRFW